MSRLMFSLTIRVFDVLHSACASFIAEFSPATPPHAQQWLHCDQVRRRPHWSFPCSRREWRGGRGHRRLAAPTRPVSTPPSARPPSPPPPPAPPPPQRA